jgi:hydrogenase/urease accessory protein HupE
VTRALVRALGLLLALCIQLIQPRIASGHDLDTASLSITEVAPGRFTVRFHASAEARFAQLEVPALFPAPCQLQDAVLDCGPTGLVGAIEFPWLEGTLTRVMVDVQWQSGTRLSRVATPSSPSLMVYGISSAGFLRLAPIIGDYGRLGLQHILTGLDHLFFVIALTLLVESRAALLAAITAFTLAHSLTLSATALGLVSVPAPPVEATIALSIVVVCAECLRPGQSLTRRAPWLVAFAFGLLHGLGFASALLEIGLPAEHVPLALLCFNVGVELGQLAVIGAVVAVKLLATRRQLAAKRVRHALVYAMGGVASFWCLERASAVFGW